MIRAQLPRLVAELKKVEAALLAGQTTYYDLADLTNRSVKQARRYVSFLRELGVEINDNYTPGAKEATQLWISRRSSVLFKH